MVNLGIFSDYTSLALQLLGVALIYQLIFHSDLISNILFFFYSFRLSVVSFIRCFSSLFLFFFYDSQTYFPFLFTLFLHTHFYLCNPIISTLNLCDLPELRCIMSKEEKYQKRFITIKNRQVNWCKTKKIALLRLKIRIKGFLLYLVGYLG